MSSISFIVPCYNCSDTLEESIKSIYNNNFSEGDEVVIIDDASTDNTWTLIENIKRVYPGIVTIRHQVNKGSAAAARNTGLDIAKNNLIFCLDADNILYPGSIVQLKDSLLAYQLDAVAFGEIHYFIEDIAAVTHRWILKDDITFFDAINDRSKIPCGSGNYLYTKASWKRAGRYNESVGGALDSYAFGLAQLATGAKMKTLPGTFYYHKYGYESTYVKEIQKVNKSCLALQILMPYLNLLQDKDVEHIFSKKFRYSWFDQTSDYPLLPKGVKRPISQQIGKLLPRKIKQILSKV